MSGLHDLAFPCADGGAYQPGMELRDWFAGQALAGMAHKDDGDFSEIARKQNMPDLNAQWAASAAYRIADAMLAARAKP